MGICEEISKNNENEKTKLREKMKENFNYGIEIKEDQSEKIIKQTKSYLCKIIIDKKCGTGFLCKIPFPEKFRYLPVLMANAHVVTKKELLKIKHFKIIFDDEDYKKEKIINTSERRIFSRYIQR